MSRLLVGRAPQIKVSARQAALQTRVRDDPARLEQADLIRQLKKLLSSDIDRSEIADQARPLAMSRADEVDDIQVLRILECIASADLPTTGMEYL